MMEQTERSHCRRPMTVTLNAVQKLLGIGVAFISCRLQIFHRLVIVTVDLSAVEVQLSELVFGVVVTVLRGDLEVLYGSEDILDIFLGEQ